MSAILERARGASAFERLERSTPSAFEMSTAYFVNPNSLNRSAWRKAIEELLAMRSLRDDWDGEGAVAPAPGTVEGAITFAQARAAERSTPPDCVTAGANGTIYFEWNSPSGFLEVEVRSAADVEQRFVPAESNDVRVERSSIGGAISDDQL